MKKTFTKKLFLFALLLLAFSEFFLSTEDFLLKNNKHTLTAMAANATHNLQSDSSLSEKRDVAKTEKKKDAQEETIPEIIKEYNELTKSTTNNDEISALIQSMTLEEKVGQLFIIGHWTEDNFYHTSNLLRAYNFGGVIIMKISNNNVASVPTWIDHWQKSSALSKPLIAIDQEGGVVTRIRASGYIQQSQRDLLSPEQAYSVGLIRGKELSNLGITMNLAPVLDTNYKTDSFLYNRSFSYKQDTTEYANKLIQGMKQSGISSVLKHYPGHYDSSADSHVTLPIVPIKNEEYMDYTKYFNEVIKTGNPLAIMTAHVLIPNIDPSFPATLSKEIITQKLRKEVGFSGVIITDDMNMGAITNHWTSADASVYALRAGVDMLLFASKPNEAINAYHAVLNAIKEGILTERKIDESLERVLSLKNETRAAE